MVEVWKPIPRHPFYEVSDLGHVRSIDRVLPDGRRRKGQLLKASIDTGGYLTVTLGHRGQHRVHCLVMLAFRGKPRRGQEVRHIDGVYANSVLANLRYGTRKQNIADAVRHGTSNRGERAGGVILKEADVRLIRSSNSSGVELAALHGVTKACIYDIRARRTWAWVA